MHGPVFIVLAVGLVLRVAWIVGEVTDQKWLRRVCGLMFRLFAYSVAVLATALHLSFDSLIRHTGAVNGFVNSLLQTSEDHSNDATVENFEYLVARVRRLTKEERFSGGQNTLMIRAKTLADNQWRNARRRICLLSLVPPCVPLFAPPLDLRRCQ